MAVPNNLFMHNLYHGISSLEPSSKAANVAAYNGGTSSLFGAFFLFLQLALGQANQQPRPIYLYKRVRNLLAGQHFFSIR
ncbi:hypothetical protein SODALDRAFT_11991 [Sodiomyces alkalinus F11]|uniref:Uncharacterized protein n=1 Tax=Sodiomyces alkalinus (strain CBS 110278 / VKM F-3762 / F11) TaxID=1314773 RepID=A0A3N2Q6C8_SODAK|nr:hypothetical protein SODALDRAFT_11991 [Sodiomyces alkalinus F11]ROT42290.1 hypothetical protein SODALDRAFT_11991 [Sodiomyces alkalinus F11]